MANIKKLIDFLIISNVKFSFLSIFFLSAPSDVNFLLVVTVYFFHVTYMFFRFPMPDCRFRRNWRPLLEQTTVHDRNTRQITRYNLSRFLRSRHRRPNNFRIRNFKLLQTFPGPFRLSLT